jgi:hypothetical protein
MYVSQTLAREISGENFAAATFDNIVLVEWRAAPTKAAVLQIEQTIEALIHEDPRKIGFFVYIPLGNPAPDAAASEAFARTMKVNGNRIAGSALVIEGAGLRAIANRAVLTGIMLMGDVSPVPKVCSTVEEAAEYLTRLTAAANGASVEANQVVSGFSQLRTFRARAAVL